MFAVIGGAEQQVPGSQQDAFHPGMRVVPDGVRRAVGGFPFPLEPGGGNTAFSEPLFSLLGWDEDHK